MISDTSATVATFVLAALPGVIVLEIFEFGRPRIRDRSVARTFAVYLILSMIAWAAAALVFNADHRLGQVIDLASDATPKPGHGGQLVSSYIALSWRLLAMALIVGLLIRAMPLLLGNYAFETVGKLRRGESSRLSWAARVAISLASMVFAWDELFVRLAHRRKAQIVHIRFCDGTDAWPRSGAGCRADRA